MKNDVTEQKRFFAHREPLAIRLRLEYFQSYVERFPSITLFEITSFFRGSLYYLIVLCVALLLLFLQYLQSFFGIFLSVIGTAIFFNGTLPLLDTMKGVSLSSASIARCIRFLQKIPRTFLSPKTYVGLAKACGIAIFFVGIQLLFLPDTVTYAACALVLIASGMLVDLYFVTIAGFFLVIYNFT